MTNNCIRLPHVLHTREFPRAGIKRFVDRNNNKQLYRVSSNHRMTSWSLFDEQRSKEKFLLLSFLIVIGVGGQVNVRESRIGYTRATEGNGK